MSTPFIVQLAALEDIARLMEIRGNVGENRLSDPSKVVAADYAWFIAHAGIHGCAVDGRLVGFSASDPRDGTIWALFVDPAYEGRGIGQALIAAACAGLRRAGHGTATLSTEPGTRAERFYVRNGWVPSGRTRSGETVLTKAL